MRLALSGGGTGGHVYPALSIAGAAERLLPQGDRLHLLYLGSASRAEREIIQHADIQMRSIPAAPMRGRMPWEMAANAVKIGAGVAQASRILRDFRPQAVLSTGGYVSVPVALAARAARIPLAVYLPDLYPGWA
ncbi:MAG: UDP-N-acetylglucosamine--N-acetylmuramyl-(pentapeptide) pyrophosphoryl-undecaprenol N-acetylglucosamine transferase, partial [Dongiaceae bacterium]